MNNSRVFLHTSKFEGGATVLQEALYSGCQVVSTIAVSNGQAIPNFHYAADTENLAASVKSSLVSGRDVMRSEPFTMEETIGVVFKTIYGSDS